MNPRLLMSASATTMGACGIAMQFLPREVLTHLGVAAEPIPALLVQVMGAAYLGFAMMNWMARAVIIGGIYVRPLAMGNFAHFTIGALALADLAFAAEGSRTILVVAVAYALLAILFGMVMFTHPTRKPSTGAN